MNNHFIPSIQKGPLKTLGRSFNSSVTDRQAQDDLKKKIKDVVQKIGKPLLTAIFKIWAYHNLLLAIIVWPLMIYKIRLSWVESVGAYLNVYLHKWLGVSKNMSIVSLYCNGTSCPLPIHCLVTGLLLQLQQSEDQSVRDNVPELYAGKKWKVTVDASNIDSIIKISKVIGNMQIGRTGLGYIKRGRGLTMRSNRLAENFGSNQENRM